MVTFKWKDLAAIVFLILVIKLAIYYYPTMEPYLSGNVYNALVKNCDTKTVAEMQIENNSKEGLCAYYIGRSNCIDCRVALGNTLELADLFSKEYENNMYYVRLKNNINESERKYLDSIDVDNIPAIIIIYGGETHQFVYDDIMSKDYKKNFKKFVDDLTKKGD